jgi:predicted dehydrogenase
MKFFNFMAKKRYALVGTGVRSNYFISPLVADYQKESELVAFCDPSPTRMAYYNARLTGELGYHAVPTYAPDQFDVMLREQRPDCVIVTTKDSLHHDYIVRALRSGCDAITEKPMTIDAEKCRLILDTVERTKRHLRVAFNYRWSAHRTKVKELVMAGTIGAVKSVNVEYLLNTAHGADYYRRWHAHMAESGGLLVHKSTHHFDLVNWWLDAIPEEVFACGRLDFYGRASAIARGDEARTRYARYTDQPASDGDPFQLSLHSAEDLEELYFKAEKDGGYLRDRNVFREDIDIYDNMSAVVRYRTGELLNYSLLSFSSREGMRVSLNGDRGRIEYHELQPTHILANAEPAQRTVADQGGEAIRVYPHFKPSYDVPVVPLPGNHNGADPVLAEQMFSASAPADPFNRAAGHEQGAASILIGVAANNSIASNRPVRINDLAPLRPAAKKLSELT